MSGERLRGQRLVWSTRMVRREQPDRGTGEAAADICLMEVVASEKREYYSTGKHTIITLMESACDPPPRNRIRFEPR